MAFEALGTAEFRGSDLGLRIWSAARKRRALAASTDAYRLIDGEGDDFPGLVVERYGDYAVVNVYGEGSLAQPGPVVEALIELGALGVYVKARPRADLRQVARTQATAETPASGCAAPIELVVREHAFRFSVRLADGFSTGLFVDQRDNRQWLATHSRDRRVLNLFAYTGSFSVAAGHGGASQVTTVDLSQAALKRCDVNLRLNQLDAKRHRLLRADAVDWLRRAVTRADRYDLIVLDPPSFASVGKDTFSVAREYQAVCAQCLRLLARGGALLAVTNFRGMSLGDFERTLRAAAADAQRAVLEITLRPPALDCTLFTRIADLATKSAVIRVDA
jgi:23S rRNA (cytosine1962-C5)-methyltransferase